MQFGASEKFRHLIRGIPTNGTVVVRVAPESWALLHQCMAGRQAEARVLRQRIISPPLAASITPSLAAGARFFGNAELWAGVRPYARPQQARANPDTPADSVRQCSRISVVPSEFRWSHRKKNGTATFEYDKWGTVDTLCDFTCRPARGVVVAECTLALFHPHRRRQSSVVHCL